ncbi:MAG: hypothetical protein LBT16_07285 [Treponema sp.]|jgi:hypothetical protein|nr:hypothetical protein [Treponema sp.]
MKTIALNNAFAWGIPLALAAFILPAAAVLWEPPEPGRFSVPAVPNPEKIPPEYSSGLTREPPAGEAAGSSLPSPEMVVRSFAGDFDTGNAGGSRLRSPDATRGKDAGNRAGQDAAVVEDAIAENTETMEEGEKLFLGYIREADGAGYSYHKEKETGKIIKTAHRGGSYE